MTADEHVNNDLTKAADTLVADFALIDFVRYVSEQIASVCGVPR